jgi:GAF domain-containing protein
MSDKKAKTKRSDRPPTDLAAQLKVQRDSFVHTFFKKGAEFTEELLGENERLRRALAEVESANTSLRTQLASDEAIRDLLRKIDALEREKKALLSHVHEAEAVSTRFGNRHAQIEEELSNLASLHVASYHLHSTLKLPLVVRHLKELLAQIVGARAFSIWMVDESRNELWSIAHEGAPPERVENIRIGSADVADPIVGAIERVFLTGVAHVPEETEEPTGQSGLVACLPMRVDDRAVGVIVIFSLFPQKDQLVAADYELFKMLGLHAASALLGSSLFCAGGGKLLGADALRGLLHADEAAR